MLDLFAGGLAHLPSLQQVAIPDGVDSLGFFALFKDFLDGEIAEYSRNLLRRVGTLCAFAMGTASDGISSVVQMQGVLGLVLSTLIMGAPPAAAMLFRGLLANFNPYSVMAGPGAASSGRAGSAPPLGQAPYSGAAPKSAPTPLDHTRIAGQAASRPRPDSAG
ncbi:hypothetical protein [Lysobacter enzymogenes]|uniref:hypothetical protein n=1 Tax=Lysobacter enzymogenes TaxID=69 RepID=UPI00099C5543|nr:hypothetical protein [Lysobacter enzymogenes]UZW61882.1 hypothetical protein BV903_006150 [Lysobacter enzymogenes]